MTEPTKKHRQRAAELIFPMMVTSAWVDDPNATYGLDTAGLARLVVTAQAFADFEASLSESRGELRASERQGGDGWVKATALPSWLPGIYWLKYDDGSVGERTARRENGGWHYGGGGREHATVIEFCKAVPPVSRPALSADDEDCVWESAVQKHMSWLFDQQVRFTGNPQVCRTFGECAEHLRMLTLSLPVSSADAAMARWAVECLDAWVMQSRGGLRTWKMDNWVPEILRKKSGLGETGWVVAIANGGTARIGGLGATPDAARIAAAKALFAADPSLPAPPAVKL